MSTAFRLADNLTKAQSERAKGVPMPDPFEIIEFRGWQMSRYTAAAVAVLELRLGYELTIMQGPYNDGSRSAGTHLKDGVIDLAPYQARRKARVARDHCWAAFYREPNWDGRGGGEHVHMVLNRPRDVDPLAEWQRDVAYPNHWNGLVGNGPDNMTYHPDLKEFNYAAWWHAGLLDQKITGLNARIATTRERLSSLRARRKLLRQRRAEIPDQ